MMMMAFVLKQKRLHVARLFVLVSRRSRHKQQLMCLCTRVDNLPPPLHPRCVICTIHITLTRL